MIMFYRLVHIILFHVLYFLQHSYKVREIRLLLQTDKTMTELEIDLNSRLAEWDTIQEAGSKLQPLFGSGYTGMRNLGNR